jgi:hypothetical protein
LASVYSTTFAAIHGVDNGTVITNESENTWIIRDVEVFIGSESSANLSLVGAADQTWFFCESVLSPMSFHWSGRHILAPGDAITVLSDLIEGDAPDLTLCGYSLTP